MTNSNKLEPRKTPFTTRCKLVVSGELLVQLLNLPSETIIQHVEVEKDNVIRFDLANVGEQVREAYPAPDYKPPYVPEQKEFGERLCYGMGPDEEV